MALADRPGFGTHSRDEDTGDLQVEIGIQAR